jgi:site-specific recombinase XerD
MTEDNVRKLVKSYGTKAKEIDPTIPKNLHPHMFRHSIAMHLYQNGVALPLVSQWLGHSRLETTLIYAYADTEQKRKAIENAIPEDSTLKEFLNADRYTIDDDETIKALYGLK